jgi:hypothetical protein
MKTLVKRYERTLIETFGVMELGSTASLLDRLLRPAQIISSPLVPEEPGAW